MKRDTFEIIDWVMFVVHLFLLLIGALFIVFIANYGLVEEYVHYQGIFIFLIALSLFLLIYQSMRLRYYYKDLQEELPLSMTKTISTIVCYSLDILLYIIVIFILN